MVHLCIVQQQQQQQQQQQLFYGRFPCLGRGWPGALHNRHSCIEYFHSVIL